MYNPNDQDDPAQDQETPAPAPETHPTIGELLAARLLSIKRRKEREAQAKRQEEERLAALDNEFIAAFCGRVVADTGAWLGESDLRQVKLSRLGSGFYRLTWEINPGEGGTVGFAHGSMGLERLLDYDTPILWVASYPGWAAYQTTDLIDALAFAHSAQT